MHTLSADVVFCSNKGLVNQYKTNAYSRAESCSLGAFSETSLSNLIRPCFYYLTNLASVSSYPPVFLFPENAPTYVGISI
jgi:hypothetical protein